MAENLEKLNAEIVRELEKLGTMEPGTEKHTAAVESLERLYKLNIESTKIQNEADACEREERIKKDTLKSETTSRNFKTGAEIGGIVLTTLVGVWVTIKGFKFEETGTFCSTTFRNCIPWFKPKK